jgi:hypothetical protein
VKRLVEEVSGDGLEKLLGERVILLCAAYFYEGKLVGVNDDDVCLSDPHIVFGVGEWDKPGYETVEAIKHAEEWFIKTASIESYGRSKKND